MTSLSQKRITKIYFDILSDDEIIKMGSQVNITKSISIKKISENTLNDEKMGPCIIDNNFDLRQFQCTTCHKIGDNCIGHPGYIDISKNPVYILNIIKILIKLLNCFCYKCGNTWINKNLYDYYDRVYFKNCDDENKLKLVENLIVKNNRNYFICFNCKIKNKYFYLKDNNIYCDDNEINIFYINEIINKFNKDGLNFLKFKNNPNKFIKKIIYVMPPINRLKTNYGYDDFTNIYESIIKKLKLLNKCDINKHEMIISKLTKYIHTLINNKNEKNKNLSTNKPYKSLLDVIQGKSGIINKNIKGRRVNNCARTVISSGPDIPIGYIGVPKFICKNLYIYEKVNKYNYDKIVKLYNEDNIYEIIENKKQILYTTRRQYYNKILKYNHVYVIDNNGKKILYNEKSENHVKILIKNFKIKKIFYKHENQYIDFTNKYIDIKIGHIIKRNIDNDDIIMFNRQPTLRKESINCYKIKVLTNPMEFVFRLPLSITKPFNADFDGDEMNLHMLQSLESICEGHYLMNSNNSLISSQRSEPIINFVQDSILGVYFLTFKDNYYVKREVFYYCYYKLDLLFDLENFENRVVKYYDNFSVKNDMINSKILLSLCFPKNLYYDNNDVIIKDGILINGIINGDILNSQNGLLHIIKLEYNKYCLDFIKNLEFLINYYLSVKGSSLFIDDFKKNEEYSMLIKDILKNNIFNNNHNFNDEDLLINTLDKEYNKICTFIQNKIKNIKTNNLYNIIFSKSKGNIYNIIQMIYIIGQQIIDCKRIDKDKYNNYYKTLSFMFLNKNNIKERGFIVNSFVSGLNISEFYFQAISGRKGLIDQSISTAANGYLNKEIDKNMENIKKSFDGKIIDENRNVVSYCFGFFNLNPKYLYYNDILKIPFFINLKNNKNYKYILNHKNKINIINKIFVNTDDDDYINKYYTNKLRKLCYKSMENIGYDNFDDFKIMYLKKYYNSILPDGDNIGLNSSSNISEINQQSILNNFHLSGILTKDASRYILIFSKILHNTYDNNEIIIKNLKNINLILQKISNEYDNKNNILHGNFYEIYLKIYDVINIDDLEIKNFRYIEMFFGFDYLKKIIKNLLYDIICLNKQINKCHIDLLVNCICKIGELLTINRSGFKKYNISAFNKAFFEKNLEQLYELGINKVEDNTKSFSQCLFTNNFINSGITYKGEINKINYPKIKYTDIICKMLNGKVGDYLLIISKNDNNDLINFYEII